METKITLDENKVRADFQAIVGELDKWGAFVDEILNDYLKTCFPSKEHLQFEAHHRVKDIDSYCEKVILRYPPIILYRIQPIRLELESYC